MEPFAMIMKDRLIELADYLSTEENFPALSIETLLDAFVAVYTDCRSASNQNDQITGFLKKYLPIVTKLESLRVNTKDFEILKTLATGAVGKVCLVRSKKNELVYAMKILKKQDLLTRQEVILINEAAFFMEERNALVFSQKSCWITTLYASFQDEDNLYLVMEYVSGGSFRALMNTRETIMTESEAKFYIAEMILALQEIHQHHYIHRDIKPENYLLDSRGHIKLADFGSCIRVSETAKVTSHVTVGTPDYISPEILRANEGQTEYGISVDWWSIGIILYELLVDEVPFYSESLVGTYGKIMNHEDNFAFPVDVEISTIGKDLISKFLFLSRLICNQDSRLGKYSAEEIKSHPWFADIDWENIRNTEAPFIPELSGPEDTRYFEDEEDESKKFVKKSLQKSKEFCGSSLAFVGYNYVHDSTAQISYGNFSTVKNAELMISSKQSVEITSLEAELRSIKQSKSQDQAKRLDLENYLSLVQNQKNKTELENKLIKNFRDQLEEENLILQQKVSHLKNEISHADIHVISLKESVDTRVRLEKDIIQSNNELCILKEALLQGEITVAELNKKNSIFELKLSELDLSIASSEVEKKLVQNLLNSTNQLVAEKNLEIAEIKNKVEKLQVQIDALNYDNNAKNENIASNISVQQKQNEQIQESEKSNALLNLENQALKAQVEELHLEVHRITADHTNFEIHANSSVGHEISDLQTQLDTQLAIKLKLQDNFQVELKSKALKELEMGALSKTNFTLTQEIDRIIRQVKMLEMTNQEITEKNSIVQSEKLKALSELSNIKIELSQSILALKGVETSNQLSSNTLSDKIRQIENLKVDVEQSKCIYQTEAQNSSRLKAEIFILHENIENEIKMRSLIEIDYAAEHQILLDMQEISTKQQMLNQQRFSENTTEITGLLEQINVLQDNKKALLIEVKASNDSRDVADTTNANTIKLSGKYKNMYEKEVVLRIRMEEQLLEANKAMVQSSEMRTNDKSRVEDLLEKCDTYEKEATMLRDKLEAVRQSAVVETTLKTKDFNKPLERTLQDSRNLRFRMSGIFFKPKDLSIDSESAASLEGDEAKVSSDHRRNQSRQSMLSTISGNSIDKFLAKSPTHQLTVLDFFNPMDGLQGTLKIPKGGKVKKGWKSQFLIFSDNELRLFEDEAEYLSAKIPGKLICLITCEIFAARSVTQNELIHANSSDIDLIFKIQANSSSLQVSDESDEKKSRIEKLEKSIDLEEKMLLGVNKILSVTTDAQKVLVIGQIDAANKRLRSFKSELENLQEQRSETQASNIIENETGNFKELNILRKNLQSQLDDEVAKREALSKLAISHKKKKGSEQSKNLEMELITSDRLIAKTKESLELLKSNDYAKLDDFIQKSRQESIASDCKGHIFSSRQYFKPTDCGVCFETLWDTKNSGMECTSCKLICHKACRSVIDVTCQNQDRLKTIPPLYFMAQDVQDRARWLAGLAYYRKDVESRSVGLGVGTNLKSGVVRLKTFVEPMKRMSLSYSPR